GDTMSYAELWSSMGLFAKGIVVVMFIMSAWSWAVSISKQIYLRKSQKETRKFAPEFSRYLQEEQLDGAIALAEKNKKSHVARVLGEALAEVKPLLRDRATITAADINSAERAVERQMLIITAELKRGLGILATTGATAPFVGLLGTTMGIVTAFQGMAASGGGGSLAAITGGVAEALITTAFGLMVAIPAVWLYNYFSTAIDYVTVEMTYTSKELIDFLIKSVGSEFGRSIFTKEFQTQKATQSSGPISKEGLGEGRVGQGGHQRHADDRRDAGALDHLHDRDAGHRRGGPGVDSACQSRGQAARGQRRNPAGHRQEPEVLPRHPRPGRELHRDAGHRGRPAAERAHQRVRRALQRQDSVLEV